MFSFFIKVSIKKNVKKPKNTKSSPLRMKIEVSHQSGNLCTCTVSMCSEFFCPDEELWEILKKVCNKISWNYRTSITQIKDINSVP